MLKALRRGVYCRFPHPGRTGWAKYVKQTPIFQNLLSSPTHVRKNLIACLWCQLGPVPRQ